MASSRISVVGAGVTGLSTALALHEDGHDVRVVDPARGWGRPRSTGCG
ncbi:MAG: hypothetical protein AWU55_2066 [Halomonadaceae bacterium T82-2]|nr:MAG: hypothetical protein AWU55_2066 [Halomonadaceae bacterium T82-2]